MTTFNTGCRAIGLFKLLLLAAMVVCFLGIAGCASTSVSNSDDEGRSTSTTFYGKTEGLLVAARDQRMAGNYNEAIRLFKQLANKSSADSDMKAQATLEIGNSYSNLMNQQRDFAKAKEYYLKVIQNYPDTEWQTEAQKKLNSLEESLQKK